MSDIKLKINDAPLNQVATQALSIISKMQDKPGNSGVQVAGAAVVFRLICERFGLDERDLYSLAGRVIRKSDTFVGDEQLNVVREYLRDEM